MKYFKDRTEAGKLLADQLEKYKKDHCAVLALSEGAVIVGAEIAKRVHGSLVLLTMHDVILPRELEPLAAMSSAGTFTYNHNLSHADLEEITTEMRPFIDQTRLETFKKLNRIVSKDGEIDRKRLKNHTIIIVSDGLANGLSIDVANDFLKMVTIKRTVIATPICNIGIVDRIHLLADDFYCIDVIEDGFPLAHYYDENEIPDHETVLATMENISLQW